MAIGKHLNHCVGATCLLYVCAPRPPLGETRSARLGQTRSEGKLSRRGMRSCAHRRQRNTMVCVSILRTKGDTGRTFMLKENPASPPPYGINVVQLRDFDRLNRPRIFNRDSNQESRNHYELRCVSMLDPGLANRPKPEFLIPCCRTRVPVGRRQRRYPLKVRFVTSWTDKIIYSVNHVVLWM